MPHPLLRKPAKGANAQQNAASQQALNQNQYVGEIFVGRRKVWEGRAATEQDAFRQAQVEQTKYQGANPEVKVKRVKPVK